MSTLRTLSCKCNKDEKVCLPYLVPLVRSTLNVGCPEGIAQNIPGSLLKQKSRSAMASTIFKSSFHCAISQSKLFRFVAFTMIVFLVVHTIYTILYAMLMYYLKELTFPAVEQRLKESRRPLLNVIPAFKGSAECLAGRKLFKIIH